MVRAGRGGPPVGGRHLLIGATTSAHGAGDLHRCFELAECVHPALVGSRPGYKLSDDGLGESAGRSYIGNGEVGFI